MMVDRRTTRLTTLKHKAKAKLGTVRVLKRKDLTPDLMLMWVERPAGYDFKPGQYCTVGIDGIERAYSIVSAPHEDALELFFELVPEGELTPRIWRLKPGDSMTIRPRAKGIFTMDPAPPNQLLVATVTGVVPYVSFVRDYLHHRREGHHFHVLEGASYMNEFAYDGEFMRLAQDHSNLITFVPTVSRPDEAANRSWTGEKGRVNSIVEGYIAKKGLTPQDTRVYACGHPGMIEDVKGRMLAAGFPFKEERFWKED